MLLLFLAACFLAYSNGANDNFKGVVSLYGSKTASYRTALTWATITTFAGSICSIFFAQALLRKFSGKGLVPDSLVISDQFLLAVVIGAALTVILATFAGFPVSTTHGLVGALVGAGWLAVGPQVNFAALGKSFVTPLLLSPVLAIALGALLYIILRTIRLHLGIGKEWCVCAGQQESRVISIPQPAGVLAREAAVTEFNVSVGEMNDCETRYVGSFIGLRAQQIMDLFHFGSAGTVCFARALNDTPKIAAVLLIIKVMNIRWGFVVVAAMMVIGGLLHSRKVAQTMSQKLSGMNHGQGFSANLATGVLVIAASACGLPVSTTHVAVGSIYGVGLLTGKASNKVMTGIVLSWMVTLPCAALLAAVAYAVITRL